MKIREELTREYGKVKADALLHLLSDVLDDYIDIIEPGEDTGYTEDELDNAREVLEDILGR